MRRFRVVVWICALPVVFGTTRDTAPDEPPLALVGGTIYPSPDSPPIKDGTVVVANGKILSVGARGDIVVPRNSTRLDCSGMVITAGFQNSHVHFTEAKWADAAHQPAAILTDELAAMFTRYGFTTVVDTGSLLANTEAIRRRIDSGEVVGPRILTAGTPLYPPGGVPYYVKDTAPADILELLPQPATPRDAAQIVDQNLHAGADILKLFTGSWVTRGHVLPMPADVATGAAAEAHRLGALVFAHPSNVAGLEVALDARVDVLAHAVEETDGLRDEHLSRMTRQNMALVPTLKLFGQNANLDAVLSEVNRFAVSGGQILFGTDVGFLPDSDPTREYELMVRAGLTPREILASLTTAPAARFHESSRRGRLAPGMDADIVVLGTDPAADARAFADVRRTIRHGVVNHS